MVERATSGPQQQPRFYAAARRIIVACAAPGLEEDIVHQIFGLGSARRDALDQRKQDRRVAIVECPERFRIAARHGRHESHVARFGFFTGGVAGPGHFRPR